MKQIFAMSNDGYSTKGQQFGEPGLCFGYSATWAYLLHDSSNTNPLQSQQSFNYALWVQDSMEDETYHLGYLKESLPVKAFYLEGYDDKTQNAKKKLNGQAAIVGGKNHIHKAICNSVPKKHFTLSNKPGRKYDSIITGLIKEFPDETFLIDIGGHWIGMYSDDPEGIYLYFDPNFGAFQFDRGADMNAYHVKNMREIYSKKNVYFSERHYPLLFKMNKSK